MSSLSFKEKSLWGNLIAIVAVFGGYFEYASQAHARQLHLGGALVCLVLLQIGIQIILSISSRDRLIDERDRRIAGRGYAVAYVVLVTYIWMAFGYILIHSTIESLVVVNLLIVALVTAEVAKLVTQLIFYRASL